MKNEFWHRWPNEYLNQLQHRYKWKERCENVQLGTMVIIKEDKLLLLKWPLGRIVKVIKGDDGLVRVSDVRTAKGIIRRPIHRLAPLPIEDQKTDPEDAHHGEDIDESNNSNQNIQQQLNPSKGRKLSNTTDSSLRKRPKLTLGNVITTILLTCLILPTAHGSPAELEPFITQPGIFFENLGTTNLISSTWNLIVFYDMRPFWAEFNALKNCSREMDKICNILSDKGACDKIVNNFSHLTMELEATNTLLRPSQTQYRPKRGAINLVGNIASALFGVLDSKYAEDMANTISNIQGNEDHLKRLLQNQTSLMDATINVIKRNQQNIHEQLATWNRHINQITAQINHVKEEFYQEKLATLFTHLSMQSMMTITNFQRIQGAILNVLTKTHHGKISPQLITPEQLRQELATIKGHLPPSLRLPATLDDVLQFYNLMIIEGRPTQDYIIFKLSLPLLTLEDFELFGLIPVPALVNNTFFAIQPSNPYLVVNLHRDQYYPLAKHELQDCLSVPRARHLCKQLHPIHRRGSSISACEIDLLNHMPQPPFCTVEKLRDGPHWIQLHHPNQWIYALREKTTINVVCGSNVTQMDIKGSGILKLQQGNCVIKQELITIMGHNTFPSSTRLSYLPGSNLTTPEIAKPPNALPQQTLYYDSQQQELENIKEQLQQFDQQVSIGHQSEVHQYTIGYLSLVLVVVTLMYILWKHRPGINQSLAISPPEPVKGPPAEEFHRPQNETNDFQISFTNQG